MQGTILRVVLVAVLVTASVPPAAAQTTDPQTTDEFLEAFREMSGDPALDSYGEFELVRSQGIVAVQVQDMDRREIGQMSNLLFALRNFSRAYELAQAGDYRESLTVANRTRLALERLDARGGGRYSDIAGVGLERFYRTLGDRLATQAENQANTRRQIQLFRSAATAYRFGGASERYADLLARVDRMRADFRRDVEVMNESTTAASTFLDTCGDGCADPVSAVRTHRLAVFDLYGEGRQLNRRVGAAASLASNNGLEERVDELGGLADDLSASLLSLAAACALFGVPYVVVVGGPAMVVTARVGSWRRDLEAAQVGDVLSAAPLRRGGTDARE